MQIYDKITAKDERAGGENDAGSYESALNTTAHEETGNSLSDTTEHADLKSSQVGDGEECSRSHDKMYGGANMQGHEDSAFPVKIVHSR